MQGSTNNHQAWRGGYLDHVSEVMNIANVLYEQFVALRPLPFSRSDLLLVVFLHDLEKPWKYELGAATSACSVVEPRPDDYGQFDAPAHGVVRSVADVVVQWTRRLARLGTQPNGSDIGANAFA